MKLLLLIVLLTCVIEYQLFVGASNCSNCSNGGSNSGRCNNKSCCNKSKCKTSCSNCGERCARLNCNNCGTSNTGCNKKQCDGHETTNNCPTTIRPIITTEVTTVTGKPTNDKVNINIKLSNKIETKNDVNVPIGISLANKNILISTRNESTSGGRNCSTKCPTPPSNDVDIETWTIPPPVLPSVPPRTPEILLTPPPPTGNTIFLENIHILL